MEIHCVITPGVLVDYSLCHRKALLTLKEDARCVPNEYVCILNRLRNANRARHLSSYKSQASEVSEIAGNVFFETSIKGGGLDAYCDVLYKKGENQYEPTIITGTYSVTNEQRLELLFIAYAIGKIYGQFPLTGNIFDMNGQRHKVKLGNSHKIISPLINSLRQDIASDLPPAILIKHCLYCQFQNLCEIEAERNDDLSRLDRLTPRLIARFHKKGIFTVKQLSFTFKPRRSGKHRKTIAMHKPELQALALRTGKIYLQEIPELQRHSVELFLDIEGVPDRRFHYLIGLLIKEGEKHSYHSCWAETLEDEKRIWQQFLAKAKEYPDAPIYHFGSYEPKALRLLSKRNSTETDWLKKRLVNINSHVFGKVYFPVRSNKLKAIGKFIGATWTSRDASGLQSLVWRHLWEETLSDEYKQQLLQYNQEDCNAVRLLVEEAV